MEASPSHLTPIRRAASKKRQLSNFSFNHQDGDQSAISVVLAMLQDQTLVDHSLYRSKVFDTTVVTRSSKQCAKALAILLCFVDTPNCQVAQQLLELLQDDALKMHQLMARFAYISIIRNKEHKEAQSKFAGVRSEEVYKSLTQNRSKGGWHL